MNQGLLSFYRPSGRFGNQMFQLHFLRQLENKFNFNLVHGKFEDLGHIGDGKRKIGSPMGILKPSRTFAQEDVKKIGFEEFEFQLEEMSRKKQHVHIKAGFLGEYFHETQYFPTSTIFPLFEVSEKQNPRKKQVAIHFRGTDFQSWDSNAVMEAEYYKNAIHEVLSVYGPSDSNLRLFTDDHQHETVTSIKRLFGNRLTISNASPSQDFLEMCQSDIIIHSPSTFSFWATLLGAKKVNVYSKTWLDYKTAKNDKFWTDFRYKGFINSKIDLEI